jgi:selenide,water dikinase
MQVLNAGAADAVRAFEPNAVTDVTGFGLIGHSYELAERSGVAVELHGASLPALPGALELADAGVRTGGDSRNRDFAGAAVTVDGVGDGRVALAYDPQTAGGLLISLPESRAAAFEQAAAARDVFVARIGHIAAGSGVSLSS